MQINNVLHKPLSFCAKKTQNDNDKNPISKAGEDANLVKATALAGLGVGAKALWYLSDEGFAIDEFFQVAKRLVNLNKANVKGLKKDLLYVGAFGAVVAGFIVGVAALYTIYKTPEIAYKGKVNAFKKGKDMDLYATGNDVEKELYNQMNDKAKEATPEEKETLKQQYLKLKAAKNQTPDFIQLGSK